MSTFAGVLEEMSQKAKHVAHLASKLSRKALQGRQDWGMGSQKWSWDIGRGNGEKGLLLLRPSPFFLAIRILQFPPTVGKPRKRYFAFILD